MTAIGTYIVFIIYRYFVIPVLSWILLDTWVVKVTLVSIAYGLFDFNVIRQRSRHGFVTPYHIHGVLLYRYTGYTIYEWTEKETVTPVIL